ncbi:hypothetical protein ACMXYX_06670 [Neptuniibacter sp. QD72_48]|uniref:hypothetical protein n=1 Tax=unclassified Neptuniibacter TaxID=2630693 RepID=UPI0039F4EF08
MISCDKFTIQEHEGEYEGRPLQSALFFCGERLDFTVPGYLIDQQFELPDYYLLFLNWDCPFEEGCEVIVISKQLELVGSYSFMPFYNSYLLDTVVELSKDHYKLTFNGPNQFEMFIHYPKQNWFKKVVKVKGLSD